MKKILLISFLALFLISFASAYWTSNLNDGLVAYYDFNEGSGSVSTDKVNSILNGTITSGTLGTWNTSGVIGGSYYLNTNSWIIYNKSTQLVNEANVSYAIWIYPTKPTCSDYFDEIYGTTTGGLFTYSFVADSCTIRKYSGGSVFPSGSLIPNQWNFLVFTHDKGNGAQSIENYYLNGVSNLSTISGYQLPSGLDYLFVGKGLNGNLTAMVDEFAIYNRTLTADEVIALYNAGAGLEYEPNYMEIIYSSPANGSLIFNPIVDFNWTAISNAGINTTTITISNSTGIYYANTISVGGNNTANFTQQLTLPIEHYSWYVSQKDILGNILTGDTKNLEIADITYRIVSDYTYPILSPAGQVAEDTTTSLATTTNWFPIIITIVAMVALILLVALIIMAMKGVGFVGGTA